jgi:hypothetical protein
MSVRQDRPVPTIYDAIEVVFRVDLWTNGENETLWMEFREKRLLVCNNETVTPIKIDDGNMPSHSVPSAYYIYIYI